MADRKRTVLIRIGVVVSLVGLLLSARPLRDVVQEGQGHCDWVSCVTTTTIPLLLVAAGITLVGVITVVAAALARPKRL